MRVALFLALGGGKPRTPPSSGCFGKGRVSLTPRSASQQLARDSGPYYHKQHPRELFLDSAAAGSESQALSSEVIRLVVETIYGYIDEIIMTSPCQWGRGA